MFREFGHNVQFVEKIEKEIIIIIFLAIYKYF